MLKARQVSNCRSLTILLFQKGFIMKIETDVMQILDQCRVDGKLLFLPDIQLDRKLYVSTNKVLALMGGKWNRSKKAHVFSIDNAADLLNQCIETGEITDIYKELQFFETPKAVVELMLDYANIVPTSRVLEPSAGKGAIAKELRKIGCKVDVCEIHPPFAEILFTDGFSSAWQGDFLDYNLHYQYSHIVANPPFSKQQDIDHASRMLELLAPGGTIVCIMSAGVEFRKNRKTLDFIGKLDEMASNYEFVNLPEKSFKDSGTLVNTIMLVANRNS